VQGGAVRIEILERAVVAASIPVAVGLDGRAGQPVGFLRRLRYSNDRPVAIDYRYIPVDLYEQLDNVDLEHEAIWETLERKLGLSARQSNTTIKASTATTQEARLLELPVGSPVLNRGLQLLVDGNRAVLAGHSIYHPDRFVYATTISMTRGSPSNRI
jgi:GntR family transcriptional regulator